MSDDAIFASMEGGRQSWGRWWLGKGWADLWLLCGQRPSLWSKGSVREGMLLLLRRGTGTISEVALRNGEGNGSEWAGAARAHGCSSVAGIGAGGAAAAWWTGA